MSGLGNLSGQGGGSGPLENNSLSRCPNYSCLTGHTRSCAFFEIPPSGLRMPPQAPAICAASAVNVHGVRLRRCLDSAFSRGGNSDDPVDGESFRIEIDHVRNLIRMAKTHHIGSHSQWFGTG